MTIELIGKRMIKADDLRKKTILARINDIVKHIDTTLRNLSNQQLLSRSCTIYLPNLDKSNQDQLFQILIDAGYTIGYNTSPQKFSIEIRW